MKVNFITVLMKTNFKILIFIFLTSCYSNNGKEEENHTILQSDTLGSVKRSVVKKQKLDTINYSNYVISFNNNKIITKKGEREALFVKKFYNGVDNTIILFKIDNGDNFISNCNDPICAIVLITQKNKIKKYIKIPILYEEEFDFLFKDNHGNYYFSHYSSPAGYTWIYIINTKNNKIYKTDLIEEYETLIKQSFNFRNNTFKVKSENKIVTKHISIIKTS